MSVSYKRYLEIKNKYCIAYFGVFNEFIFQLIHLIPILEEQFPELDLYIACKNELISNSDKLIPLSKLKKHEYAVYHELKFNNIDHPIENWINESNIKIHPKKNVPEIACGRCIIVSENLPPVKSLTKEEVLKIEKYVKTQGFVIVPNETANVDWVIGVESEMLCKTANKGIKTTLIPSGLGTNFLKKIYPSLEVLDITSI